jgi:hypothetical protein
MAVSVMVAEPPQPFRKVGHSQFVIGQDAEGHWVAIGAQGGEGGIFVSREAALKYAAFEMGQGADAVLQSNQPLSFWS